MASTPWREGIEAIVFRTVNDQPTLWDSMLPPELLVLPVELGRVDALRQSPHSIIITHDNSHHSICLVQLKIARDATRLLGFAI